MKSRITSKGQATIPVEIRRHLGLSPGSRIKFFIDFDGSVVIRPERPISDLRGCLKYDGPPVTIEEMEEAIAEGATEGNPD